MRSEGVEPSVPAPSMSGILIARASLSVSSRWKSWYLVIRQGVTGEGCGTTGAWQVNSLYGTAGGLQLKGLAGEEVSAEPDTAHGILVWREWKGVHHDHR